MKILLLGATGRTGKHVLQFALSSGYDVNCLSRNSERIPPHNGLKIFEGKPTDKKSLEKSMAGCEAVINVLNVSRISDFPWSPLKSPDDLISDVMSKTISLAEKNDIKRIVTCSAWGVAETKKDIPFWFRWLIDFSNIGIAYKNHEKQERLLENSNLNWSIIRPVGLTNSSKIEHIKESYANSPEPSFTISRKSLAKYLVSCLKRNDLIHKKVVLSKN